jgi:hypothetical protein
VTGLLIAGLLIGPSGGAAPGWIAIDGGRVTATGRGRPPGTPDVEHDGLIAPGLVDLQVNGAAGREALEGGDALDAIDDVLAWRGVTSWLAALPTAEDHASRHSSPPPPIGWPTRATGSPVFTSRALSSHPSMAAHTAESSCGRPPRASPATMRIHRCGW